jgi:hypothetical protein
MYARHASRLSILRHRYYYTMYYYIYRCIPVYVRNAGVVTVFTVFREILRTRSRIGKNNSLDLNGDASAYLCAAPLEHGPDVHLQQGNVVISKSAARRTRYARLF